MRVWVVCGIIGVVVLLALMPLVAYVMDNQTRVSGNQMVADMRTLQTTVMEMGPGYQDVAVSVAPDRSRIIVVGTVASADEREKLKAALKSSQIKAPLSRVTFNVKVK
jgi:hypothetical protein